MTALREPGGIRSAGPASRHVTGFSTPMRQGSAVRLGSPRHDLAADLGQVARAAMQLQQLREASGRVALADAGHVDLELGDRLAHVRRVEHSSLSRPTVARAASMHRRRGTAGVSPSKPHARTSGRTVGSKQPSLAACTLLASLEQGNELGRQLDRLGRARSIEPLERRIGPIVRQQRVDALELSLRGGADLGFGAAADPLQGVGGALSEARDGANRAALAPTCTRQRGGAAHTQCRDQSYPSQATRLMLASKNGGRKNVIILPHSITPTRKTSDAAATIFVLRGASSCGPSVRTPANSRQ